MINPFTEQANLIDPNVTTVVRRIIQQLFFMMYIFWPGFGLFGIKLHWGFGKVEPAAIFLISQWSFLLLNFYINFIASVVFEMMIATVDLIKRSH